ncbi:MAG: hypothetical protein Q4C20_14775 [Erysipelotrichaceae bacterium]|nr:hypothetical protein [Erysipelotrichaceae bacterium]
MAREQAMNYLQFEKERFEAIRKSTEERLRGAPEGTVCINKHGNGIQFYFRSAPEDKKGRYLPVAEKEKALALVQKKYDRQVAEAAEKQIIALKRFMKSYDPDCLKKIYEAVSDVRKDMIVPAEIPDELYAQQWQSTPFQPKKIEKDVPEHYSNKGERVRSKSEVMIADALAQAGVPHRYECPFTLGTAIIHPDFTVLRKEDRKELFWEHLGKMDDAEYVITNLSRIRLYEQNGIMPGINLILTMETRQQPINLTVIKQMIRTYCI